MVSAGRRPRSSQKAMKRMRSRSFCEQPRMRRGSTSGSPGTDRESVLRRDEGILRRRTRWSARGRPSPTLEAARRGGTGPWSGAIRLGAGAGRRTSGAALVLGQGLGVEPFVSLLVRPLVVEAGLADVRDDDPVAAEVDGVVERLVDRRDLPAGERPVERVFRPFALDGRDVTLSVRAELAEDGVGELAVGLDVLLARDRVTLGVVDRPRVAEQFAEDVVEEVAEDFLLLVGVDRAGGDDLGPLRQLLAFAARPARAG